MVFNLSFIDCSEGKSFTVRNIRSIDYLFNCCNAWLISVRNGSISSFSMIYIYAKGFWFISTAFFQQYLFSY